MRYIDKNSLHGLAHDINVRYLKDCYAEDLQKPVPSPADPHGSYEDFKKPQYRDGATGWKKLLLDEQSVENHPRCCYCMRRLDSSAGRINYEHIIPRSLSGREGASQYEYYTAHAPILKAHVIMADNFVTRNFASLSDIDKEQRMPHITGLSNLVAACNGKRDSFDTTGCCCNGNRGDAKILPVMLMPDADSNAVYDANGIVRITCNDGTLDNIINDLNEETLMEIRSVWYHLSRVSVDIVRAETMTEKERVFWFKKAYMTDNFALLPEDVKKYSSVLSENDTYWRLLLAYDWFYFYPGYARQRV